MAEGEIRSCCAQRSARRMLLVVTVALAGTAAALAQGRAPVPDAAAQDRARSYELEVQFTRIEGTNSVVVMLPFGRSYGMLQMSGWNGRYSGLNLLNGAKPNDQRNVTARPGVLPTGQRLKLSIRVLLSADGQVHFASTLNDRPYIEWRGPQEALSEDGFWRMGAQTLGLGTNSCRVVFHSVRVRDIAPPE